MALAEYVQEVLEQDFDESHVESLPRGVVSLYELLRLEAAFFLDTFTTLNGWELLCFHKEHRENRVRPEVIPAIRETLERLKDASISHNLESIGQQCSRILQVMEVKGELLNCGVLRDELLSLRTRCEDEFSRQFLLQLDSQQAFQYQKPLHDWQPVSGRFPKVRYNIEESSKCFALERYGAAVFHILQVAEYGVIQVAKLMGVEGDKPGWGCLSRLQRLIDDPYPKRTTLAQQHSTFLEHVIPLAIVVKDSWRHKLEHVDNHIVWMDTDFSPNVAEEILKATRGFMRKLAQELPR